MSSNLLYHDPTNAAIKQQRNCITFEGKPALKLQGRTQMHDDPCHVEVQTRQAVAPSNYVLTNLYDCNTRIPDVIDRATTMPMVYYKNGYEVAQAVIDESTQMRLGATKKYPRCRQQLFTRPYLTVPDAHRGPGNITLETELQPGESTLTKRSCNVLSGVNIPNFFTPLLPYLASQVQNEEHIIESVADPSLVRGGANSRLIIQDANYLAQCGYSYMDKSTNPEFWIDKFKYL